MKSSLGGSVLVLILGSAEAFPYGSYLKSLSNPPQPPPEPEPAAVSSSSSSLSSWSDYNPNPLSAAVGGPVDIVSSVATAGSMVDAAAQHHEQKQQPSTHGFGLPYSLSGQTTKPKTEVVDPYVAAYAAFQKSVTPPTNAKVATVNLATAVSSSSSQPPTNNAAITSTTTLPTETGGQQQSSVDPYAAMEAALRSGTSRTSLGETKRRGVSSYLDALSSATSVPKTNGEIGQNEDTPSAKSSYTYQGPPIGGEEPYMSLWLENTATSNGQRETIPVASSTTPSALDNPTVLSNPSTPLPAVDESPAPPFVEGTLTTAASSIGVEPPVVQSPEGIIEEIPEVYKPNPFATGNEFYAPLISENSMELKTPESLKTTTPPVTQPRKPFGAGSYLENLAKATVEEEPPSAAVDDEISVGQSTKTFGSSRPLIPIHAIKVAAPTSDQGYINESIIEEEEERPFFATFLPKPPVRPRGRPPLPKDLTKSRLQRIMERTTSAQAGGAGGASTYAAFQRVEENWSKLKKSSQPFKYDSSLAAEAQRSPGIMDSPPQFVSDDVSSGSPRAWMKLRSSKDKKLDYDAVVCGGTLGIFFATALALKGNKVCVLEAGDLRGREQEWNISMDELKELVRIGVLTDDDIEAAVTTEFPGCRAGFKNKEVSPLSGGYKENGIGYECVTPGVLNLGVSPAILLERVKKRFLSLGGQVKEQTRLEGVVVSEKIGSALDLGEKKQPITSRLVVDCMGNESPISRQQRYGKKPDGVCAVVGSCAGGFAPETNTVGDIIYTNSEIKDCGQNGRLQYFWEAFPVGIGRDGKEPGSSDVKTTYMFTYFDADENRPSLEMLMEDYFDMLPTYQKSIVNSEDDLDFKRVLFAFFPTYQDSPLKPQWSRILAVGDASGIQSPLSFGGFGSLTRHLDRITTAVSEALEDDLLQKDDLAEINAYQPNLSAAWMFQKAMSIRMGQDADSKFVNRLLATNFEVMNEQGPRVIKPFLQDVVRFDGLASSLSGSFAKDPMFMPDIIKHVGVKTLAQWVCHVAMMGVYAFLHAVVTPLLSPFIRMFKTTRERFQWRRRMDSWKYGSGSDFVYPTDQIKSP